MEDKNTEVKNVAEDEVLAEGNGGQKDGGVFAGDVVEAIKPINKNLIYFLTIILVLLLVVFFTTLLPFYNSAKEIGNGIGSVAGNLAGKAVGSWEGITKGIEEGTTAGKEQGLSAEDTTVEVANKIQSTGKLDVLVADGQIEDTFSLGDDHQVLFLYKSTAVFSVDLTDITVTENNGDLYITVPNPVCDVSIDQSESEKMAEWQRHFWSGDTDAAYEGYMNSMLQIQEKAETQMEELYSDQAKTVAQKTISQIANSASGGKFSHVEVTFQGERE